MAHCAACNRLYYEALGPHVCTGKGYQIDGRVTPYLAYSNSESGRQATKYLGWGHVPPDSYADQLGHGGAYDPKKKTPSGRSTSKYFPSAPLHPCANCGTMTSRAKDEDGTPHHLCARCDSLLREEDEKIQQAERALAKLSRKRPSKRTRG